MTRIIGKDAVYPIGSTRVGGIRYTLEDGREIILRLTEDERLNEELREFVDLHHVGDDWSERSELGQGDDFGFSDSGITEEEQSQCDAELLPDEIHALKPIAESRHDHGPEIRKYILGGNALFTVVFGSLIGRRTFRVKSGKRDRESNWSTGNQDRSIYWVSLKIGPGNGYDDFITIGRLAQDINGFYIFHPKLNRDGQMHFVASLFSSLWTPLDIAGVIPSHWEFYHASSCCVCGRTLTVPSSIQSGIGPECEGKMQ